MNIMSRENAPRYKRDNIESFLFVSQKTTVAQNLTVTLVEMEKGGIQKLHSHEPEQMYYILEGIGEMKVNDETRTVQSGDCIFFNSQSTHGLKNTGNGRLRYLSAASPSFTREQCENLWPLKSINDEGK